MIPANFEEIKFMQNPASYPWERDGGLQNRYETHKKMIAEKGLTAEEYILDIWSKAEPYATQSFDGVTQTTKYLSDQAWLVTNAFHYELPPECIHYVLWLKQATPQDQVNNILSSVLSSSFDPQEFRAWINKKANQSVKGLTHYQVITSPKYV